MSLSLRENVARARALPRSDAKLEARAALLRRRDRELLLAALSKGVQVRALAELAGVDERTIRHRVHQLARRLCSRRFLQAARALSYLPPLDARVALLRFCQNRPVKEIAATLGISLYNARQMVERVQAKIDTLHAIGSLPPLNVMRDGWRASLPPIDEQEDEA